MNCANLLDRSVPSLSSSFLAEFSWFVLDVGTGGFVSRFEIFSCFILNCLASVYYG